MTARSSASTGTGAQVTPAEGTIVAALRKLPPGYRADVLRYVEFLDYKSDSERSDALEEAT